MTFALTLADPEGDTFPCPASPVIVRAQRRSLRVRLGFIALAWAANGAMLAGVTAGLLVGEPFVPASGTGPLVPLSTYLLLPILTIVSMTVAGEAQKRIYGYSVHLLPGTSHNSFAPRWGRPVNRCTAAAGCLAGLAAALVLLPWDAWADAAWWRQALAVLLFAVFVAGALLTLRSQLPRVRLFRERHEAEQRRFRAVLDGGARSVARVTRVERTGQWLDSLPVFLLGLTWPTPDGPRDVTIRITEYPCWAPVLGNEFDVWYDPGAPGDDSRVHLRRRLIGQRVPDRPESFRAPAVGDSGAGPVTPRWMPSTPVPGWAAERWIYALLALLGAAVACAATALTPTAFPGMPGIAWLCLAVESGALLANAVLWLAFATRRPRFAHGADLAWIAALPFLTAFGYAPAVLGADPVWRFDFDRDVEVLTSWLYGGTILAALLAFLLTFALVARSHRMLNAGVSAPPEEIEEALRHHDPAAIERLRTRYGYLAGGVQLI
ncbi:hypothetical protein ACL02R_23060 [Streptomyces sp. MS19]|uniref:hypothetical protein n=1 Tax=Streptomyces sp. MS19 TaxID=3385972 RepID=UPI00399FB8DF